MAESTDFVRYAEQRGFHAVWQADSRLVREATVPMAAFAAGTERIKVGSGVLDMWTRNPARLAATFSTLDDLAPGRILCGLGAWWDPLAAKVGVDRRRPLRAMREVVTVVRALLNDENVTFSGDYVQLDGVELDYVNQPRRAKDVPIYIGATGMKMMELTGEIADGVVLNYLVSADYNRRAMDALAEGAARAGRTVDDLDRPQLVVCSLAEDRPRPWTPPACWSPSTWASSPTSWPLPACPSRCWRRSTPSSPGRPPWRRSRPPPTRCPTRWCRCCARRAPPRNAGNKWTSTWPTGPPVPSSTPWAPTCGP